METDEPDGKRRKSFSKREIVQKLIIGEKLPFAIEAKISYRIFFRNVAFWAYF